MLGKLVKHEWKATYKLNLGLIAILAGLTILGCLSFCTPLWTNAFQDIDAGFTFTDLTGIMSLIFYFIGIFGVLWGLIIYLGVHFYRNMYSSEGYLTHTLPASSHQLLISRILVGGIWYLILQVLIVLSIFIVIFSMLGIMYRAITGEASLWTYIMQNQDEVMKLLNEVFGSMYNMDAVAGFLYFIFTTILGAFVFVMTLYGAITIGQLSAKHKVMMSIVSYIVISMIKGIIAYVVALPSLFYVTNDIYSGYSSTTISANLINVLINLVLSVGLYFISNYIITRKLNLE